MRAEKHLYRQRFVRIPLILTLAIVCSCIVVLSAQTEETPATSGADATFDAKIEELLTTVYCYCGCERETIEKCVCQTAVRIESDFREQLLAGQTVEQIRTNYLDTYGPQFYAIMPAEGINLLAYTMPAVILLIIGGIAFAVLRKSRRHAVTNNGTEVPTEQVSDATVEQVEAELQRYKQEK